MNIVITGAASGIGLDLVKHYQVIANNISILSIQEESETKGLFNSKNVDYYQVDVTNLEQIQSTIEKIIKKNSTIELVIACAGLNMPKTAIPDFNLGNKVVAVNALGVCYLFQAVFPYFQKQLSGHFVAISSLSALNGLPGMSYYSASKVFVATYLESLACDLKQFNIHFTTIVPGFIATDFVKNNNHPMPFLLSKDKALKIIIKAIQQKKNYKAFPLIPFLFMRLLSFLPRSLYVKLMQKDILKLRQHE
jgi:short-subunit dehydrogenase